MKTQLPRSFLTGLMLAALSTAGLRAAEPMVPDLQKISQGIGAQILPTAAVRWEKDVKGKPALFTKSIIWLDGIKFTEGTIECDILGKSTPRGSNFPGVVFNGKDASSYESIYFRPFNFRAENPENSAHAVQYVAFPLFPWQKLRAEKTGQFEKPITPLLDGDAWFRAKIVVEGRKVRVYVNGSAEPSLEVERLGERVSEQVGITGGDAGEGGYFANVRITPKG